MDLYSLVANKDKSAKDFNKFLSFMVEEMKHVSGMEEDYKKDFIYHYGQIPAYFEKYISRYEHAMLNDLASIELALTRLKEKIGG